MAGSSSRGAVEVYRLFVATDHECCRVCGRPDPARPRHPAMSSARTIDHRWGLDVGADAGGTVQSSEMLHSVVSRAGVGGAPAAATRDRVLKPLPILTRCSPRDQSPARLAGYSTVCVLRYRTAASRPTAATAANPAPPERGRGSDRAPESSSDDARQEQRTAAHQIENPESGGAQFCRRRIRNEFRQQALCHRHVQAPERDAAQQHGPGVAAASRRSAAISTRAPCTTCGGWRIGGGADRIGAPRVQRFIAIITSGTPWRGRLAGRARPGRLRKSAPA